MKKTLSVLFAVLLVIGLTGCGGAKEEPAAAAKDKADEAQADSGKIAIDNAFYYTHINGHGDETQRLAYILFEYEQLETVKYQVAYLACTCRGAEVNYYSVAYVELSKEDGSVAFLSYDQDSTGHYTAGLYGDSVYTWDNVPAKDNFKRFREQYLIGAKQDQINAIEPLHGDVDSYTGATVTPNNAVSMLKELFKYHNAKYL